jgi:hypothetical protein
MVMLLLHRLQLVAVIVIVIVIVIVTSLGFVGVKGIVHRVASIKMPVAK